MCIIDKNPASKSYGILGTTWTSHTMKQERMDRLKNTLECLKMDLNNNRNSAKSIEKTKGNSRKSLSHSREERSRGGTREEQKSHASFTTTHPESKRCHQSTPGVTTPHRPLLFTRSKSMDSDKKRPRRVRFADSLGLDLENIRYYNQDSGPPSVPSSAFKNLLDSILRERSEVGARFLAPYFQLESNKDQLKTDVLENKVKVESCSVDDARCTVHGAVRVANIGYHKTVTVRYTCDDWVTHTDTHATYVRASNDSDTDQFSFLLNIPRDFAVGSQLSFAVKYNVNGQDFWDNNRGSNYTIKCFARIVPTHRDDTSWIHFL